MITVLLYILGVVAFALGLAVSIGLHELGHMIPAKKFGVKVTQYFVGFGKTVWSRRRGETEYGIKAIPLGGYVKLVGMLPPAPGDDPTKLRKSNTGMFTQLISDARAAEYELVGEADHPRLFYRLPWWKKVIVMSGGPLVNLAIAFFLFLAIFGIHGIGEATTTIGSVSKCVVVQPVDEPARACTAADAQAPAAAAGLRPGDKVLSFNGTEISSYAELQKLVRANGSGEATIAVERAGEQLQLRTTTAVNELPSLDGSSTKLEKVGYLGIAPTTDLARKGPLFTLDYMGTATVDTVKALGHMPVKLWGVARTVVGLQDRDPESPMSVVGAGRVAGEVVSAPEGSVSDKLVFFASLLAGVNLFVGMFNFVPLLPLDGGHIAGALYEAIRRGFAKLLKRPDPGFFDVAKLLPVAYVTAGVLLLMTVLLVYADLFTPIKV